MLTKFFTFILPTLLPLILIIVTLIVSGRFLLTREKLTPFECGFDPMHLARIPFSLHFFLLSVIFLVFDLEIVLLFPLPFSFINPNPILLITALIFLIILVMGTLHEWNEGSLNWSV